MKELEMYKQRAFIQLICTLFFSLTLVCVIEIYLVSFGVFSYLLIAIILVWQFSAARQRIQSMKNELDEERLREENERYNQQVYGQFLEKMSQSSREIPDIQYMGNLQSHYVNNDERMKLLQSWANNLLIKHQVHFVSLSSLVSPYIHLIEKIQKLDDSFQQKANIHPLQDLQIDEKLTENLKILHQYRALLMEKGNQLVHDYNATRLGLEGEKRVNEELALYDDVLMNIPNVRFEVNGSSVETDNLVLSPFGIFAIEVKNIGSSGKFKIKIEKDGRWVKVFKNSSQVTTNVTTQVYRHVALKQKLINHELRKLNYPDYIEIKPLIVLRMKRWT